MISLLLSWRAHLAWYFGLTAIIRPRQTLACRTLRGFAMMRKETYLTVRLFSESVHEIVPQTSENWLFGTLVIPLFG
jgi:hypothetical protein